MSNALTERVRALAREAGFDAVRIARADEGWDAGDRLRRFVEAGHHGTMGWMEETLERRVHPTAMWAEARSAVVVGPLIPVYWTRRLHISLGLTVVWSIGRLPCGA